MMRISLHVCAALLAFGSLAPAGLAVNIDAESFKPAKAPRLVGPLAVNDVLKNQGLRLADGQLEGPEDIAVDANGVIYTGTADGFVKRIFADGSVEDFAYTGGHPLGMDFAPDGRLIVCEPFSGLLAIDPDGTVTLLADQADGVPFKLADDVKVSSEGIAYFTDASSKFALDDFEYDILENAGNGRLMSYNLATDELQVLAEGLYFANGVALAADESYVLVAETARYQIRRYWLTGADAGVLEVFADNLPGLPDGLSTASDGSFWVAFFSIRSKLIDSIQPFKHLKNFFAKLPKEWLPNPQPYGFVAKYDPDGEVVLSFHDDTAENLGPITSVQEFDGQIYMGTLQGQAVGVLELME